VSYFTVPASKAESFYSEVSREFYGKFEYLNRVDAGRHSSLENVTTTCRIQDAIIAMAIHKLEKIVERIRTAH
jgi:hypothetical protein